MWITQKIDMLLEKDLKDFGILFLGIIKCYFVVRWNTVLSSLLLFYIQISKHPVSDTFSIWVALGLFSC